MNTRFKPFVGLGGIHTALDAFQAFCKGIARVCKGVATNATKAALAIGVASNADVPAIDPEAADGWLLLAPYCDIDYLTEEKGELCKYTQSFQRANADKMVSAFNALLGKKGARYRGLPIYKGHPDTNPERWPDEARLGGVMGMEAREDGLYVRAAWNDQGKANIENGYLVYPSPAWKYDQRTAQRTQRIEPDELQSVGLTNSPRIPDSEAWTNSQPHHQPNADTVHMELTPEAKKKIIKMLGLADNATDAEVATAVNAAPDTTLEALRTTASNAEQARTTAETQATTVIGERDTARTERDAFRTTAVNALLDAAINERRITAAERPAFVQQFATNFDAAAQALPEKKSALPHQEVRIQRVGDDLATPASRRVAYNARVDQLMAEKKITFHQAHDAMRDDPRGSVILKAIQDADKAAAK